MENNLCLEVKNLKKYFPVGKNFFGKPNAFLKAVDDISFTIEKGTTLGLVGESGCGKTTVGRSILRLHEVTGGQVLFKGLDLATVSKKELRRMRPQMQIIFQDPYSSLSPRMPVGAIIGEAVKAHKIVPKKEFEDYILGVMQSCGLQRQYYDRYPHEFPAVNGSASASRVRSRLNPSSSSVTSRSVRWTSRCRRRSSTF